ncbi:MAG: GNAT family N-acetyltransferase [Microbacteriaceae bacterium]
MVRYLETSVTDAAARALLTEYFDSRRESFPADQGTYTTTFPEPTDFVAPNGVFLVVDSEVDGAVEHVGCGGIRRIANDPRSYEVKHLWVQPRTRGHGLGRLLLAELERRALQHGATRVVLDTNASQAAAAGLYRATGYEAIEPYNTNPNATHWFGKTVG